MPRQDGGAVAGLAPVNGFKTNSPEEELALVIIDCGGTLRCGIYVFADAFGYSVQSRR